MYVKGIRGGGRGGGMYVFPFLLPSGFCMFGRGARARSLVLPWSFCCFLGFRCLEAGVVLVAMQQARSV